jgi:uncharacterized Zn finger protein
MARIELTEESLRATVDQHVFAQAVALAGQVTGLSAAGPQVEATVDGTEVSVRVRPGALDARCACPAADANTPHPAAPCPHAVAAVLAWVRTGSAEAGPDQADTDQADTDLAADLSTELDDLRTELDDVLGELAAEAGDCDPDDGWYPDTADLEDLLDEVEDLTDEAPEAARELAGHVAGRVREVLAAGNCLTDDLADALARAEELRRA